ncbi:MAG: nitroreductase family protein [Eubacteriales bacterium]|nr:nitroreductase family protein [Eubacteriales bacterium]
MDLLQTMLNRRSVRQYADEPVPKEKLEKILQAGLAAPTGRNKRPWEFVAVEDKETLRALSGCRQGAAKMLEHAGCAVLVFAHKDETDVWTEDCSIAMSFMHLMADSLGLGSCWIQGRLREAEDGRTTEEFCRELLGVPEDCALEAILSVGVLKEHPAARGLSELPMEKVHFERF